MADAVRVDSFLVPAQMAGEDPSQPAFSAAVQVSSPVRMDQLAAEVTELTQVPDVGLISDGDPLQASAEAPMYLWTESAVPPDLLEAAAQAHHPVDDWAPDEAQRAPLLDAIREKARQHRMLTPDEMQVAVAHLLTVEVDGT